MAEALGSNNNTHKWESALIKLGNYLSSETGGAKSTIKASKDRVVDVITSNYVQNPNLAPSVSGVRVSTYIAQLPTWINSLMQYKDAIEKTNENLKLVLKICDRDLTSIPAAIKWKEYYKIFIKGKSCDCFVITEQSKYIDAITNMNVTSEILSNMASTASQDDPSVAVAIMGILAIQNDYLLTIITFNCCMKRIQEGIPKEFSIFGKINAKKFINFKKDMQLKDNKIVTDFNLDNGEPAPGLVVINPFFERKKTCKCSEITQETMWNLKIPNPRKDTHEEIKEETIKQTNLLTKVDNELKCRVYCCGSSLMGDIIVSKKIPKNTSTSLIILSKTACKLDTLNEENNEKVILNTNNNEEGDVIQVAIPSNIINPNDAHRVLIDGIIDPSKKVTSQNQVFDIPIRFAEDNPNCTDDYNEVKSFSSDNAHSISIEKASLKCDKKNVCKNNPILKIKNGEMDSCRNLENGVLLVNNELKMNDIKNNSVIISNKEDFIREVIEHDFRGTFIGCSIGSINGFYTIDTDDTNTDTQALYKVEK